MYSYVATKVPYRANHWWVHILANLLQKHICIIVAQILANLNIYVYIEQDILAKETLVNLW